MTVIVGLQSDKHVWMGGDSASAIGCNLSVYQGPKVFRLGDFLLGVAGTVKIVQTLQYRFTPPEMTGEYYIETTFADAIRECLKAQLDEKGFMPGRVMVGFQGQLYVVNGDFSVVKSTRPYTAIGDGASVALGALMVMGDWNEKRRERDQVMRALEIAEEFIATVRRPFEVRMV